MTLNFELPTLSFPEILGQILGKPNRRVGAPAVSRRVVLAQENQVVTRTVMRAMGLSRAKGGPARSEFRGESDVIRRHGIIQFLDWHNLAQNNDSAMAER